MTCHFVSSESKNTWVAVSSVLGVMNKIPEQDPKDVSFWDFFTMNQQLQKISNVANPNNSVFKTDAINPHWTALMIAAQNDNPEIVKQILDDKKIDPNEVNKLHQTVLMLAAQNDRPSTDTNILSRIQCKTKFTIITFD